MQQIFCDICKAKLTEVYRGVRIEELIEIVVGKQHYKDVCTKCMIKVSEFIDTLKK